MATTSSTFGCACADGSASATSWWRIILAAFLSVNSMTLTLAVNVSEASPGSRWNVQYGALLGAVICGVLVGGSLFRGVWDEWRQRRVTIDTLFLMGVLGASGCSFVSLWRHDGPVYFEVVGLLFVIHALGRTLGQYSQRKVIELLSRSFPSQLRGTRVTESGEEPVLVTDVRVGDLLRVHPGQAIPVDGVLRQSTALLHESQWSGESFAVSKTSGDAVVAGTHVVDATVLVEATSAGTDRQLDRLLRIISANLERPAKMQLLASRVGQWFVPLVAVVSAGTFGYWASIGHLEMSQALFHAMAVLLVACPCAIGFATPVAIWSAMARLGEMGFVSRSGAAVEALAEVDTAVFDKTGTLTDAEPQVDLVIVGPWPECEVRALVSAAERAVAHPLARVLQELDPTTLGFAKRVTLLPGRGIDAQVELESRSFEVRVAIAPDAAASEARRLLVHIDGLLAAEIRLLERVLPRVTDLPERLRALGVETALMTGDAAERVAATGFSHSYARLTPQDKRDLVASWLARDRKIVFVGDGVNDAAAMSECAVSIAVPGAAPLAEDVASMIWMRPGVVPLVEAITVAREASRTIKQNLWIALGYNALGMALAASGRLHPVAAAVLMTVSSLVVTFRALQLLNTEEEELWVERQPSPAR